MKIRRKNEKDMLTSNDDQAGVKMTICQRCFKEYEGTESLTTPMEQLGQIFQKSVNGYDVANLCPECIEELGIVNLMGFQ